MDPRATRAAKNEALFRQVNERIEEVAETFEAEGLEVLCECDDPGCTSALPVTVTEYKAIRASGDQFVLIDRHEDPGVEDVVERSERFIIVRKRGEAGEVARELDTR